MDEKQRSILLTEDGYEAAEDVLQARAALLSHFNSTPVTAPVSSPCSGREAAQHPADRGWV